MNIYEFNKGMYQNVPPMDDENVKEVIFNFLKDQESSYYLMLNHDIHYYTVFHTQDFDIQKMVKEIFSIAANLGPIVDIINNQETKMLEIWIKYENQPMMFGLFDYTRGVVEV